MPFFYLKWVKAFFFFFYGNCEISPCCVSPPRPPFIVGYLWSSAQGVATSCSLCVFQAFVWWQMTSLVSSDSKFTCHFMCLISTVWNAFLYIFFQLERLDFDAVVALYASVYISPLHRSPWITHSVSRNILSLCKSWWLHTQDLTNKNPTLTR